MLRWKGDQLSQNSLALQSRGRAVFGPQGEAGLGWGTWDPELASPSPITWC